MKSRLFTREEGQAMVMVAVAMIVMIAMAALVMDGGYAYLERRRVQNAADAAALAGVRSLAKGDNETAIRVAINDYALRNGITSPNTSVRAYFVDASNNVVPNKAQQIGQNGQVPNSARAVLVEASKQHQTFFARAIGVDTMNIVAVAQAGYDAAAKISGLLPIAMWFTSTIGCGSSCVLWDSDWQTEGGQPVGGHDDRGWLNFDGGSQSGNDLVKWVHYGYNINEAIPLWINGSSGVVNTVLHAVDSTWLMNGTVFIPIFDVWVPGTPTDGTILNLGNDNRYYHIVGFGAFNITSVVSTTKGKIISGNFVRWVASDALGGPVDTGVLGFRLTPPARFP